jgi:hypothetical protein
VNKSEVTVLEEWRAMFGGEESRSDHPDGNRDAALHHSSHLDVKLSLGAREVRKTYEQS